MHASIITITLLLVCGVADAAFRKTPPATLHLLDRAQTSVDSPTRLSLFAQLPGGDVETPPPLLSAPGGDATDAAPPQGPAERTPDAPPDTSVLPIDPHAGSFAGGEVALGALLVFATDAISAGAFIGVVLAAAANRDPVGAVATLIIGGIAVGAFNLIFTPLAAALGVYAMAPKEGNNGLLGAVLGAYLTQFALAVIGSGIYLASAALIGLSGGVSPNGAPNAGATIVSLALTVVFAGLHWVGLPLGASYGIHWGTGGGAAAAAVNTRRPLLLPTRPHEAFAEVLFTRPGTLATIPF